MSFPRYPAYKASGVTWLPATPSHWQNTYLQHIADSLQTGPFGSQLHAEDYVSDGTPIVNPKYMRDGRIEPDNDVTVDDFTWQRLAHHALQEGDIVFARRGELGRSALITANENGWLCGTGSLRMRPRQDIIYPKYLIQLLSITAVKDYLLLQSVGSTMDNLNTAILARMPVTVPPLSEQHVIATFLDAETARIDALVAKQVELIATLQEKRRALISHAVTKGLNPSASMKDSGVPWLGEVPSHWDIKPIKYIVHMVSGGTPDKSNLDYWDGAIPWASAKDLKKDALDDTEDHITEKALSDGASALIPASSVLIVVRGMILAHTLPVTINVVPMAINQDLKALRPKSFLLSSFLAFQMRGLSEEFLSRTDTAGHGTKALRTEDWNDIDLVLPPVEEQRAVIQYLEGETRNIDTLIAKAEQFIALLREHRAALIAAAVTGQIDVRGYAAGEGVARI